MQRREELREAAAAAILRFGEAASVADVIAFIAEEHAVGVGRGSVASYR